MKSVKFFITPIYPYGNDHYYHEIIVLAEGFKDLGYKVIGNADYWFEPENNEYLIQEDITAEADINIYDYRYTKSFSHLLFRKNHLKNLNNGSVNVLVDVNEWWASSDWMIDEQYSVFDIILVANMLKNVTYKKNVYSTAKGITHRQMMYIDKYYEDTTIENAIAYNFREPHNLRKLILTNLKNRENELNYPLTARFTEWDPEDKNLTEADRYYWEKTLRRHNPAYFKNISQELLFFAVGGYFQYKPVGFQPYNFFDKMRRKPWYLLHKYLVRSGRDISDTIFIFQYDSFRFWETLYAKTAPILLDCDYWNFDLPVQPIEGTHYLGIKDLNLESFVRKLQMTNDEDILQIGRNGRKFVVENYSPKATAERLLKYIDLSYVVR